MAQKKKPIADKEQAKQRTRVVMAPPIRVVLDNSRGGRRRKGTSSRGTRRLTDIEQRVTKAVRRVTRAVDHGVDTYIERRDKSSDKRRDGVVVDAVENLSYGASKTLSEVSPVLSDAGKAFNTRRVRRFTRRLVRGFASIPLFG